MPFSRETPDMIQHQSRSHPTIIAEIIQMNSVLKFFCRDWRMSDSTRTMSTHRCNVCQRQAVKPPMAPAPEINSPRWHGLLPTTWIKGTPHDEIPVIRRFSDFFSASKKRQVLNRHGNVLRTPVPGIPNPS